MGLFNPFICYICIKWRLVLLLSTCVYARSQFCNATSFIHLFLHQFNSRSSFSFGYMIFKQSPGLRWTRHEPPGISHRPCWQHQDSLWDALSQKRCRLGPSDLVNSGWDNTGDDKGSSNEVYCRLWTRYSATNQLDFVPRSEVDSKPLSDVQESMWRELKGTKIMTTGKLPDRSLHPQQVVYWDRLLSSQPHQHAGVARTTL